MSTPRAPRNRRPPSRIPPDDAFPEIGAIHRLSKLHLLRIRLALRENNPRRALDHTLIALQAGKRMADGRGTMINYLTGLSMRSSALPLLADAARHPDCTAAMIRDAAARLDEMRSPGESLAYAFRAELYFSNGALAMAETQGLGGLAGSGEGNLMLRLFPRMIVIYKGNKTRRLFADTLREAIVHIDADASALALYRERQNESFKKHFYYNPENAVGRILLAIITPTWSSLIRAHAADQSRISAHQAQLALLAYEREQGALPRSLGQLIPGYLDAEPLDHFTRQPIRYDPDLKVVWSAGENDLQVPSPGQEKKRNDIILWLHPAETSAR